MKSVSSMSDMPTNSRTILATTRRDERSDQRLVDHDDLVIALDHTRPLLPQRIDLLRDHIIL